jgi:hypothetical protein
MIICASDTGLEVLKRAEVLSVDGTFASCPSPFIQVSFVKTHFWTLSSRLRSQNSSKFYLMFRFIPTKGLNQYVVPSTFSQHSGCKFYCGSDTASYLYWKNFEIFISPSLTPKRYGTTKIRFRNCCLIVVEKILGPMKMCHFTRYSSWWQVYPTRATSQWSSPYSPTRLRRLTHSCSAPWKTSQMTFSQVQYKEPNPKSTLCFMIKKPTFSKTMPQFSHTLHPLFRFCSNYFTMTWNRNRIRIRHHKTHKLMPNLQLAH